MPMPLRFMSPRRLIVAIVATALVLAALLILGPTELPGDVEPVVAEPPATKSQLARPLTLPEGGFDDAELAIGLDALCDHDELTADNANRDDAQAPSESLDKIRTNVSEGLAVSSSPEELYVAALLAVESETRAELLTRVLASNPTDPFINWGVFQLCSDPLMSGHCPMASLEQNLINADGSNSEAWFQIAANRYGAGDHNGALEAMRYASTSAESRIYWPETIQAIERGFAAASDYSFMERAGFAFGLGSRFPNYADYLEMCRKESSESAEWAHICLRYGQLVEQQGKSEIAILISRSFQTIGLEALGDADAAAVVNKRFDDRRQARLKPIDSVAVTTSYLIMSNPHLFDDYLMAVRTEGEIPATERIEAEVKTLLRERPELACVPEQFRPAEQK